MKKETLKISVFVLISLIVGGGAVYLLNPPEGYLTYECKGIVGYCWKLSSTNKSCYWNQSSPLRRKYCASGWELYSGENVTGNIINLTDYIEFKTNTSDKELLRKKGITKPEASKCIKVSRDECVFKVTNGFNKEFKLNISGNTLEQINELIENRVILLINSTLSVEKGRERIRAEKDFYAQQSYGNKKVIEIKND